MSTNKLASLKARATGQAAHTTDAVADYLADVEALTDAGVGLVFVDPFLPFLRDVQNELVDGLKKHYTGEEDVLAIDHADYADLCKDTTFKGALAEVGSVPFLIISEVELGHSDAQTKFFNMGMAPLLEHRWRLGLPTVITTRHSEDELAAAYPTAWSLIEDRYQIERLR